jgi:4-diphosphocytidyl-2-C-methyl-D-erythritol kinase
VISLQARAKLNLSLAVLAKRPDGFHEIESLMVPVTLHDTLMIRTTDEPGVRLTVRFDGRLLEPAAAVLRRDVPTDDSNLVVRAVRLLAAEAGETRGLEVDLVKEIPSGAGLGGGSSDAAAALVGAAEAWGVDLPRSRLATLAAQLGSDVPFFLEGGPAIASGRGERLVAVGGMPALHAVIACPAAGLSTAAVYARCTPDVGQRGAAERLAGAFMAGDLGTAFAAMHNTLEPPARALAVDVGRLLDAMTAAGAVRPMLTGSGSACFALARSEPEARAIAARLEAMGWPGVFAVQVVSAAAG